MPSRDPLALVSQTDLRRIYLTLQLKDIPDGSGLQAVASLWLMSPKSSKWRKQRTDLATDLLSAVKIALSALSDESTLAKKRLQIEVALGIEFGTLDRFGNMLSALSDSRMILERIVDEYDSRGGRPSEMDQTEALMVPLIAEYRRIVDQHVGQAPWRDALPGKNSSEETALKNRQYAFVRAFLDAVHKAAKNYPELQLEAGFDAAQAYRAKGVSAVRNAIERAMAAIDT